MKDMQFLALARILETRDGRRPISLRELLARSGLDAAQMPTALIMPTDNPSIDSTKELDFLLLLFDGKTLNHPDIR